MSDLTEGQRLYAIGDVHGRRDLLDALFARIRADLAARPHPRPRLILLGDYIDRGPDSRGVIEALRDEPDQDVLGRRLASEAALSSVLEKALLLQRTLLTGKKEPNVAANELAVQAVDQENSALEQEIHNLKTELELRRTLAGNSAMAIIQRHSTRAAGSRGVFEGDTTRDRLREVQKPRSGTP